MVGVGKTKHPSIQHYAGERKRLSSRGGLTRKPHRHATFGSPAWANSQLVTLLYNCGPRTAQAYYPPFVEEPNATYRRAVSDEIRNFWLKHGRHAKAELWYAVLCDREATQWQWFEAARAIAQPAPQELDSAEVSAGDGAYMETPDVQRPLAGEALRSKHNPSVAQVLAQRADETGNVSR